MDRIKGLKEYVKLPKYRTALGLPKEQTEKYELLAQGEYNINYIFTHPVSGQKLLLRVNCGSQMHLKNQIQYEFDALKLLESSGRTPKPYYVDGSFSEVSHGVMVMEYLKGEHLDYKKNLFFAAECLADIHSVPITPPTTLIKPYNSLFAILEECEEMVKTYMNSPLGEMETKTYIRKMLDTGWEAVKKLPKEEGFRCCINTELNSTNFLIDTDEKKNYLIDWEKPLYGDPAQDLGHFLAPTTTFWKTDVILEPKEMEQFVDYYIQCVNGRFSTEGLKERVYIYIPITCLRGITWCAMAWVEYQQKGRLIRNESTFQKLGEYIKTEFLHRIDKEFLGQLWKVGEKELR